MAIEKAIQGYITLFILKMKTMILNLMITASGAVSVINLIWGKADPCFKMYEKMLEA